MERKTPLSLPRLLRCQKWQLNCLVSGRKGHIFSPEHLLRRNTSVTSGMELPPTGLQVLQTVLIQPCDPETELFSSN